ncbi:hypothetical protein V6N13_129241 [Hibiscus sabdariffa]
MASSSMSRRCFHCRALTETFYFGWQLRNGGFAMLCQPCGLHPLTVGDQDELEIQLPDNVPRSSDSFVTLSYSR